MSTPSAGKSDPALWKRIVARVKRGEKGGDAGQWSARKAQLATAEYQKAGGGYAGGRREDTHLARWGAEHQDDKPAPKRIPAAKPDPVVAEFRRLVNMNRTALSRWLATKRSQAAGLRKGDATESVGHQSGRLTVELLAKKPADAHSAEERAHMRKVISYIKRHSAQRPEGEVKDSVWRASLMNWGHDPLKD
jgi:hypothetical protein